MMIKTNRKILTRFLILCVGFGLVGHMCSQDLFANPPPPNGFDMETQKRIQSGLNVFDLSLFRAIVDAQTHPQTSETTQNTIISPFSVHMALSLLLNGAGGNTFLQMSQAMQIPGSISLQQFNLSQFYYLQLLGQNTPGVTLKISNALWMDQKFLILQNFTASLSDFYSAHVGLGDFKNATESVVTDIHTWVRSATHDLIQNIVTPEMVSNMVMMLLNATYLKGTWRSKFDLKETQPRDFQISSSSAPIQIPTMHLKRALPYGEYQDAQIVALPFVGDEIRVYVILPPSPTGTKLRAGEWFRSHLSLVQDWNNIEQRITEGNQVNLFLPKIKLDRTVQLPKYLRSMGLGHLFDRPNFQNISAQPELTLSGMRQNVSFTMDETGAEAAAVTQIGFSKTSDLMPKTVMMNVNRPFIVAVRDMRMGAFLILAVIEHP